MGNGVSTNQGNLPAYGKRDAKISVCQEHHDWLEQAEAPEAHSLSTDGKAYTPTKIRWNSDRVRSTKNVQ